MSGKGLVFCLFVFLSLKNTRENGVCIKTSHYFQLHHLYHSNERGQPGKVHDESQKPGLKGSEQKGGVTCSERFVNVYLGGGVGVCWYFSQKMVTHLTFIHM